MPRFKFTFAPKSASPTTLNCNLKIRFCVRLFALLVIMFMQMYINFYLAHMWQQNEKSSLICAEEVKRADEPERHEEEFCYASEKKILSDMFWWTALYAILLCSRMNYEDFAYVGIVFMRETLEIISKRFLLLSIKYLSSCWFIFAQNDSLKDLLLLWPHATTSNTFCMPNEIVKLKIEMGSNDERF